MNLLLHDISGSIEQAVELLESISVELFTKSEAPIYPSGIGAHLRHNIDHYHSLIEGLKTDHVDYDLRDRELRLEQDRSAATQALIKMAAAFGQLTGCDLDRPLQVKLDCGRDANWSRSTLQRELQFLLSHTVHHYAVIAMICRLNGLEPGAGFGIAPSTLKYRQAIQQEVDACAH